MSNKKLAVLGIVAAAMVVWAAVQSRISNRAARRRRREAHIFCRELTRRR